MLRAWTGQGLRAFSDPPFLLALSAAFLAWLLPEPGMSLAWYRLLLLALLEEFVFRGCLQHLLVTSGLIRLRLGPVSGANLAASAVFAGMHLVHQPLVWAVAVFFPSLVFGWAFDRYRHLLPCWALHFVYNCFFFYRP
jgi:hypothetical protein